MMTFTKRISGARAKSYGDGWEKSIETLLRLRGWCVLRIPNGSRVYRDRRTGKLNTAWVKSPFDYIATKNKRIVFFDAKTFDRIRIQHSDLVEHQINNLYALSQEGHYAGYLVYFRPIEAIVFYPVSQLKGLKNGHSFHFSEGKYIGGLHTCDLNNIFKTQREVGLDNL